MNASANFGGPFPTGEMVLVVVHEHSQYPEVEIMQGTSAAATIPALEKIFATLRTPEVLKADNGPPFKGMPSSSLRR